MEAPWKARESPCIPWACAPESSGRPWAALGVAWRGGGSLEGTAGETMVSPLTLPPQGIPCHALRSFQWYP